MIGDLLNKLLLFACKSFLPLLKEKYDIIDCQSSPYFPAIIAWMASISKAKLFGNYLA
jgi:hypothetical protein